MKRFFLYIAATTILTAACNRQGEEEDPVIPVTGITHNLPATLELLVGSTLALEATVEPAEAANQTVTWSTSDDQVATVNSAGELTAVALGTVTITATTDDGEFTATCTVTVAVEVIPVTGITINLSTATLLVGATLTLEAAVEPAEATNQTVTWSTSDPNVVTITPAGKVTAITAGTATITATTDDGKYTATCAITVAETGVITMTTHSSMVWFQISIPFGTDLLIDWGDETESNINDADYLPEPPNDDGLIDLRFSHGYTPDRPHNSDYEHRITITGNILGLNCEGIQLTALDVRGASDLRILRCSMNQLTTLDVSDCTEIRELYCHLNQLTTLDVSGCTALTVLWCYCNQIAYLNVSRNTELWELGCGANQLTNLDVSRNTTLGILGCGANQLTTLDVSSNTNLRELACGYNQLATLDMSSNTALRYLYCYNNQLTTSALNDLFSSLRSTSSYTKNLTYPFSVWIHENPGTSDCDVSIAEKKGWIVFLTDRNPNQ